MGMKMHHTEEDQGAGGFNPCPIKKLVIASCLKIKCTRPIRLK